MKRELVIILLCALWLGLFVWLTGCASVYPPYHYSDSGRMAMNRYRYVQDHPEKAEWALQVWR